MPGVVMTSEGRTQGAQYYSDPHDPTMQCDTEYPPQLRCMYVALISQPLAINIIIAPSLLLLLVTMNQRMSLKPYRETLYLYNHRDKATPN